MTEQKENSSEYGKIPRIGDPAPKFECMSSQGMLRLEDYAGKWVVLFSHPADFTPVCTTEFIAFSKMYAQFKELNCELIGLSIDSVFSHIAWIRNVEEKFGEKIMFPIIADLNKNVAGLYGMIMPGEEATSTSRCLFVIDDRQVIRAMIYYPFTTGRNIDEVLRLLNALQLSDEYGVGTRANWKPGDKVILFPPLSKDDSDQRVAEYKDSCVDWYFCETDL